MANNLNSKNWSGIWDLLVSSSCGYARIHYWVGCLCTFKFPQPPQNTFYGFILWDSL